MATRQRGDRHPRQRAAGRPARAPGLAYTEVPPYPLDVLGAESEGMIGYVLEQELENQLPDRNVVTVLTQVVVDADDPAFGKPTKPIGAIYTEEQARKLAAELDWSIAPDNNHFRRVVASPQPLRIVELAAIRTARRCGRARRLLGRRRDPRDRSTSTGSCAASRP